MFDPFRLPVHPPLVHFPVALLALVWAFLVVRYITGDVRWDERARLLHLIGVASLPIAMVAALIDTRGIGFLLDPRFDGPLIWHALGGIAVAVVFGAHLAWRRRFTPEQFTGRRGVIDLAMASTGFWGLLAIGLLAGEMVFAA